MSIKILLGILVPFFGTVLGAALVFLAPGKECFLKKNHLSGFAAGVMMAASVWSLILPAAEMSGKLGLFSFVPVCLGICIGFAFLLISEKMLPVLTDGKSKELLSGKLLFILAVVLHNIPEGMAVGVAFACVLEGGTAMGMASALMLSFGMAIQNIPEGAIVASPLAAMKKTRKNAFAVGALSGIVEPVAAFVTIVFSAAATAVLPYLLGFAAGAMIYVAVSELIPEAEKKGTAAFFVGFLIMMILDMALG